MSLAEPDLARLGLKPEDASAVRAAAASLRTRPDDQAAVEKAARRLTTRIGVLPPYDGADVWAGLPVDEDGVLPLLALAASAPAVAARHAARNVPSTVTDATLADLGQQVRVHRLVTGRFGLGTYAWVAGYVWSGALFRLGRLQLCLERATTLHPTVDGSGQEWVLSTHIPRTGRLLPADVDASLAAAPGFFAEHFPDVPATGLHCQSWMLDPRIPELLPASNLASFQERWTTYGEPAPGDDDVLFFAFARRPPVVRRELRAETSLQRAVLSVWDAGEHWHVVEGWLAG